MTYLIIGLIIFLDVHSVRIFADAWRSKQVIRLGIWRWKGLYALASLVGFILIVWGYGQARMGSVVLWNLPEWTRQVAAVLTLLSFVLIAAAYVPKTKIKAALGHPMIVGVKVWAFAHLMSNGTLADVVLFGSFLLWAVVDFAASRRRDRALGTVYPEGVVRQDVLAIAAGVAAWVLFALFLHQKLIGVQPLG